MSADFSAVPPQHPPARDADELCDGLDNDCDGDLFGADVFEEATGASYQGLQTTQWNIYEVSSATVLQGIEVHGQDLFGLGAEEAVVFGRPSDLAPWTCLAAAPVSLAATLGWAASGELDVPLSVGSQVAVGLFSFMATNSHVEAPGADPSWGTFLGSGESDSPPEEAAPHIEAAWEDRAWSYRLITVSDVDSDGDGVLTCDGDCDDGQELAYPGAPESCDRVDDNCDGQVDEGVSFEARVVGDGAPAALPPGAPSTTAGTLTVTVDVTSTEPIVDLDVYLDILHTCVDDLTVTLTSPVGTAVVLVERDGENGDDLDRVVMDDEAALSISSLTASDWPFAGPYAPQSPLSAFDGEVPAGTWTLEIEDSAPGDSGELLDWALHFNGAGLGGSEACSALSCSDALDGDPQADDGVCWIDPAGWGAQQVWCDQTTDGGGWTLLMKTSGGATFGCDDPLWTDSNTLGATEPDLDTSADARYAAFLELDASELRACFPTEGGHCVIADPAFDTAQETFAGGDQQIGSGFDGQFYGPWSTQSNCQWFGINSPFPFRRVRFGFTADQENHCESNDTAVGLGVGPLDYAGNSYGAGELCTSSGCDDGNVDVGFPGQLWGR